MISSLTVRLLFLAFATPLLSTPLYSAATWDYTQSNTSFPNKYSMRPTHQMKQKSPTDYQWLVTEEVKKTSLSSRRHPVSGQYKHE
jgi:hypothetical protein